MTIYIGHDIERRDDGSITVLAAAILPALLLMVALVVDGAAQMQAITRADAIAAETARAAETAIDTRGNTITIDAGAAVSAARSYLQGSGNPGTVTIENGHDVRVETSVTEPAPIGLLTATIHATGEATAHLAVGTRGAGGDS